MSNAEGFNPEMYDPLDRKVDTGQANYYEARAELGMEETVPDQAEAVAQRVAEFEAAPPEVVNSPIVETKLVEIENLKYLSDVRHYHPYIAKAVARGELTSVDEVDVLISALQQRERQLKAPSEEVR